MSENTRFVRFVISGGISALLNIASRWLFSLVMAYELAVALAYLVGISTAFVLMRSFVFEPASGTARRQYVRFAGVNVVGFTQVWLISVSLLRLVFPAIGFAWNAETIAHLIGIASLVPTSYLAHKHFSFKPAAENSVGRDQLGVAERSNM